MSPPGCLAPPSPARTPPSPDRLPVGLARSAKARWEGPVGARLVLAIIAAAVVVGCGLGASPPAAPSGTPATGGAALSARPSVGPSAGPSTTPSASPESAATAVAAIEDQVEALRGLRLLRPVILQILPPSDLARRIVASFRRDHPPELLAATQYLDRALGLLGPGDDLASLETALLTREVIGFYDPQTKELDVASRDGSGAGSGALGPLERATIAHEITHALQDQHFGLDRLALDTPDQSDRDLARLAVVEGDATLTMTLWSQTYLAPAELGEILRQSADPASQQALAAAPAFLRARLLFPYQVGLTFVGGVEAGGGWPSVDDLFRHPPASTTQLLHADAWAARQVPAAVALPADLATRLGPGWRLARDDTLGEFQLSVWLGQVGRVGGSLTAPRAAAGWRGDRIALLTGPDGAWAVALRTLWDTPSDAAEVAAVLPRRLPSTPVAALLRQPRPGEVDWVLATSPAVAGRVAQLVAAGGG